MRVTVHGSHFQPGSAVAVLLGGTKLATATPGTAGSFSTAVTIPRGTVSGTRVLTARQQASGDRATTRLVVRVNWPQQQFNARNTGYGTVLDNGLVLIDAGRKLLALNAATLATAWTDTDDADYSGIAAHRGVVYAALDDGILNAYNSATGATLASHHTTTRHRAAAADNSPEPRSGSG